MTPSPARTPRPSPPAKPARRSRVAALDAALALVATCAVAAGLPGAAAAQELPADVATAWDLVAAEHRRQVEDAGIVGSSLAFVLDGRIVRRQHVGVADVEAERAIDEATLFHWASITKTFTAVAVLQLRDRGLLALDDPIARWVPELRRAHDPFGPIEGITVRHLLSHSAGFRSSTWPWGGGEDWHPWEPDEWSQLVAMMPYTRVEFEPGSRFQYSNPGIVFLGRAIEALTGDVYEHYVDKNILRPLGMSTAYFDATPWHLSEHRSRNYRVEGGRPIENGDFNTGVTVSNGGLNGSVDDLARWLAFLSGRGDAGPAAADVLARSSLEEMWREVVPIGAMELGREAMGLGFFVYPDRGLVGHTGSQRSFFSFILLDPVSGAGAIAAFNTAGGDDTGPDTRAVVNAVRLAVADELLARLSRPTER
jgi:CubicO group peptidase (beta-lactamase class C family)